MTAHETMNNCPSDETLAAFIDGRLNGDARSRVVEHVASCAECRSVVVEAAAFRSESEGTGTLAHFPSRRGFSIAALVAAAVVVVLFTPLLRDRLPFLGGQGLPKLVEASRELKFRDVEPRLSGGFAYKPLPRAVRGDHDRMTSPDHWKLMSVAAKVAESAKRNPSVANLQALGVSQLLVGQPDESLATLSTAILGATGQTDITKAVADGKDATLLSDLSAAAYVRWNQSRSAGDLTLAVESAARAWRLDSRSPEVAWNRALALEATAPATKAIEAWNDYLALDASSPWAGEVRDRISRLRSAP